MTHLTDEAKRESMAMADAADKGGVMWSQTACEQYARTLIRLARTQEALIDALVEARDWIREDDSPIHPSLEQRMEDALTNAGVVPGDRISDEEFYGFAYLCECGHPRLHSAETLIKYQVVYWPTDRVCVAYDTREEADASVAWYKRTYGEMTNIGVREAKRYA